MSEIELGVPAANQIEVVEKVATMLGLQIQRGSLRKYPGCTHWHFTKAGKKGTLECNWWPAKHRLWLSIHANRTAEWQEEVIARYKEALSAGH